MSKGILLVNLGSPDSPDVADVRKYLKEFLMDGRVLDMNPLLRYLVVNLTILPSRPKQASHAYKSIWTREGSPLIAISKKVRKKLQERVTVPVELAMRYQNPSIPEAIGRLVERKVDDLLLIPLFPHYAMSSFETAVERVKEVAAELAPGMRIKVQKPYYNLPDYVAALIGSAEDYLKKGYDHLLFSFHGLPERHMKKADPTGWHCLNRPDCCEIPSTAHATCYRAQCFQTVKMFVEAAGVPKEKYSVAFQSRLGRDPWLKPYTDVELERLAKAGIEKMLVICPAFVSDCLETLEEIGMRGKEAFKQAGGKELQQIPCLNDHPFWIAALEHMATQFVSNKMELT
jgi:ferrochelatase